MKILIKINERYVKISFCKSTKYFWHIEYVWIIFSFLFFFQIYKYLNHKRRTIVTKFMFLFIIFFYFSMELQFRSYFIRVDNSYWKNAFKLQGVIRGYPHTNKIIKDNTKYEYLCTVCKTCTLNKSVGTDSNKYEMEIYVDIILLTEFLYVYQRHP